MNIEEEQRRGAEARRWLDDPLFKAARDDVYARLKAARIAASTTDTNLHSKLILTEQVADNFFGFFEQLAQTGKFASLHLEQEEARRRGLTERLKSYANWGRNSL